MKEFLLDNYSIITKAVEFSAAFSGSIYLRYNKNSITRYFVYYLWLTFFTELIGEYPHLLQNNYDNKWFITVKNSVFCSNHWLYNLYAYVAIGIIGVFYSNMMSSLVRKNIIRFIFIAYSIFVFIYFISSNSFFAMSLPHDMIIGTFIICIYVVLYFVELMKSEELLEFYKMPSFYISIGLMIWYLCVMPLFIYDGYFLAINSDFVIFRNLLLLFINIFTYLCFTFGFIYSLYKSKR